MLFWHALDCAHELRHARPAISSELYAVKFHYRNVKVHPAHALHYFPRNLSTSHKTKTQAQDYTYSELHSTLLKLIRSLVQCHIPILISPGMFQWKIQSNDF